MSTKATLKRVLTNNNQSEAPLRDVTVKGLFFAPPTVGQSFRFFSDPRDITQGARVIETSPVSSVELVDNMYTVTTENSTYEITLEVTANA